MDRQSRRIVGLNYTVTTPRSITSAREMKNLSSAQRDRMANWMIPATKIRDFLISEINDARDPIAKEILREILRRGSSQP